MCKIYSLMKKMKRYFETQPSPKDISNCMSSSGQSEDDHETSLSNARNDGVSLWNSLFPCFPNEVDLNPARVVIAEMVGTFILMFCVTGIIAITELMRGEVGLLEYAATAGLTVIVVIFCIGPISGAHVNPAVTIAFAIFGCFPWYKVPLYILAQTVGSVLATYIGKWVYGIEYHLLITRPLQGCASAFWVELLATSIIVFLAASLTYEAQSVGNLSGFVVGAAIALAILITGPISGGSMNPARSLGPAIVAWNFDNIWIYIIAPVIGAIAGASLCRLIRFQPPPCSSSSTTTTTTSPNTSLLSHSFVFVRS